MIFLRGLVICVVVTCSCGLVAHPSCAEPVDVDVVGKTQVAGERVLQLPGDRRHTLWIPAGYEPQHDGVDVLVHFHGSPRLVRESCEQAGLNCVVVNVTYGGLSSVYRKPFSADRQLFATILDETLAQLREQDDIADEVTWRRVVVSSFSAGFGAVRELLKTPVYFARIDGIYLVDSLYCGYVGDGTDDVEQGVVHPGLMQDFLRYAEASAEGKKVMVVTHCDGPTPGYASTRETADYLLEKLQLRPVPTGQLVALPGKEPFGLQLYREVSRNGFHLSGSPGGNETDHVQHLRHMALWMPLLPLDQELGTHAGE